LGYRLVHAPLEIEQLESLCGALPAALPPIDPATTRRFDNKALAQISTTSVKLKCL
jgi:hypothetical protein